MEKADATQPGRGRPRDAEKDEAIRRSVWAVLAEKGYDNLTFDAVAEAAGCSRTTLYRRYAGKSDMVADTMYETARSLERTTPAESDPRAQLVAHARNAATYMSGERGRALRSITESVSREPGLAEAVQRSTAGDQQIYLDLLRAIRPGATDASVRLAFHLLIGTIQFHCAIRRSRFTPGEIEAVTDAAIAMLRTAPQAAIVDGP